MILAMMLIGGGAQLLGQRLDFLGHVLGREELVQRRIQVDGWSPDGLPCALYMPSKSACCIGSELGKSRLGAAPRVSERIISRMAAMRVASKNMCSVRHRPMPSAPNLHGLQLRRAGCRRWCERCSLRNSSAQPIRRVEIAGDGSVSGRDRLGVDVAGGAVDGDPVALVDRSLPPMVEGLGFFVHLDARRSRRRSRCPCRGRRQPRGRSCRRGRSGCPAR